MSKRVDCLSQRKAVYVNEPVPYAHCPCWLFVGKAELSALFDERLFWLFKPTCLIFCCLRYNRTTLIPSNIVNYESTQFLNWNCLLNSNRIGMERSKNKNKRQLRGNYHTWILKRDPNISIKLAPFSRRPVETCRRSSKCWRDRQWNGSDRECWEASQYG